MSDKKDDKNKDRERKESNTKICSISTGKS